MTGSTYWGTAFLYTVSHVSCVFMWIRDTAEQKWMEIDLSFDIHCMCRGTALFIVGKAKCTP